VWARYVAAGDLDAWTTAVRVVRQHYQHNETATAELEFHIRPEDQIIGTGSGYVVDSLRSAKQVFDQQQDLKRSIQAAIALGHDTDTTACIAGGVVGLRVGQAGLPIEWMQQLRGLEICEPIFKKLVAHQTKPTR
jgi:ADP-ribosylglycohydrolase